MKQPFNRTQLTKTLTQQIKSWPFSIACWEGGSAANGRKDQYSDLDLLICTKDSFKEAAFEKVKSTLLSLATIESIWRIPEPTWHGHSQCLYRLSNWPKHFFLDLVVLKESTNRRFTEKEIHGNPVIYFDKKGFVQPTSADTTAFKLEKRNRLESLIASFPFYKALTLKEVLRSHPIDALAFYRQLVNLVVEMWGLKHRPFRYNFGLRYTHIEFPKDIQKKLESFSFVSNIDEIQKNVPIIESEFLGLAEELG